MVNLVIFLIWMKINGIKAVLIAKQASIVVNQKGIPNELIITETTS